MNRFLGKAAVSILSESLQLPPTNVSKERQQTVNPHYIPRLFTLSRCHQRCLLDRDRMQMTRFSFYDHDATQSECAHRLPLQCSRLSLLKSNSLNKPKANFLKQNQVYHEAWWFFAENSSGSFISSCSFPQRVERQRLPSSSRSNGKRVSS